MYVINEIKENYKHFYGDQVPKWIKRSAFAVLFAIAVKLFILYALASTISVFVALWGFITAFPLLFAFITISFSTLVVCFYLISLYKDEEAFAKADKIIQYLMLGWVTSLFLFCFGQLAVNIEIVNEFFHSPLFLLLLFICIIIFFILKWMSGKVNSETIETIRIAKIRMIRLEELAIKISTKLTFGESFLMRNTHILEDDFEKWLDQLIFLSECLFSYRNKRLRLDFLYRIIPSLDGDIITILNSNRDNIQAEDEEDRLQYIKYLLRWKDAEDAKEKLTEIKETKARSRKFWKKIAKPFVAIGKGIGWIFEEIGDFFSTSVRLWEYFNKHCPYIHKTETLQFRTPQAIDLDEW